MFTRVKDWVRKNICERGQNCSCFIDRVLGVNIGECCKKHDSDYETIGYPRLKSDQGLRRCIYTKFEAKTRWKKKLGYWLAQKMYKSVRKFGKSFYSEAQASSKLKGGTIVL